MELIRKYFNTRPQHNTTQQTMNALVLWGLLSMHTAKKVFGLLCHLPTHPTPTPIPHPNPHSPLTLITLLKKDSEALLLGRR